MPLTDRFYFTFIKIFKMLECLTGIVGVLKDVSSPIITGGLTTDEIASLQVSKSGLFLDELPGGVHMKALKYTDVTKPFATMTKAALSLAQKTLEDDLIIALRDKYNRSRKAFIGQIGQLSYASSFQPSRRYQYVRMRPVDYIDAVIKVSRVTAIFNGTSEFLVSILEVPVDSVMGTEITTVPFSVLPNQFKTVEYLGEQVIKLPLLKNGQLMEYWFVYDTTAVGSNIYPKDMSLGCNTCGAKTNLASFLQVTGGQFDSLADLSNRSTDNLSHGLVIDVEVSCSTGDIFCKEYNEDDATAITMAYCVWFKAGELLIEDILKSPDVNRYTTQAREYLWGKRNHFRLEYQNRIKYLAATIDVQNSNCYVCRQQDNQPSKGRILV